MARRQAGRPASSRQKPIIMVVVIIVLPTLADVTRSRTRHIVSTTAAAAAMLSRRSVRRRPVVRPIIPCSWAVIRRRDETRRPLRLDSGRPMGRRLLRSAEARAGGVVAAKKKRYDAVDGWMAGDFSCEVRGDARWWRMRERVCRMGDGDVCLAGGAKPWRR